MVVAERTVALAAPEEAEEEPWREEKGASWRANTPPKTDFPEPSRKEGMDVEGEPEAAAAEAERPSLEEQAPERTEPQAADMEIGGEETPGPAAGLDMREEPAAMEVRAVADAGRPAAKRATTSRGIRT